MGRRAGSQHDGAASVFPGIYLYFSLRGLENGVPRREYLNLESCIKTVYPGVRMHPEPSDLGGRGPQQYSAPSPVHLTVEWEKPRVQNQADPETLLSALSLAST